MNNWYKQPLLHFVLAGVLLFVFYEIRTGDTEPADSGEDVIVVDRAALIEFMQYRANAFDEQRFARQLDAMSDEERQALIDEYVREEALYRQALALDMEEDDYNIKLRLVEKMRFLLQDSAGAVQEPGEEELRDYYRDNASFYERDRGYTFVHVFVDDPEHSQAGRQRAEELLARLRANDVTFEQARDHGDRFPFLQYNRGRRHDIVQSNFGDEFVALLEETEPSEEVWHGPVATEYGYHLVMLTDKREAGLPPLEEVRARVLEDYRVEMAYRNRVRAEENLVGDYRVEVRDIEGEQ